MPANPKILADLALFVAMERNDLPAVQAALAAGASLEDEDPLHTAAVELDLPQALHLLALGTDVNAVSEYDGTTPLFNLVDESGYFYPYDGPIDEPYLQMVETLLAAGADVSARADCGLCRHESVDKQPPSVLEIATQSIVEYAEMLLEEYEKFCEITPPEFQRDVDAFSDRYYYLRAMERAYQLMVESPTNIEKAAPLRTHWYYSQVYQNTLFHLRHLLRSF